MGKTPLPGLLAPLAGNESAMGTRVYLPRILCAILGSTTEVDSTAKAVRLGVESHRPRRVLHPEQGYFAGSLWRRAAQQGVGEIGRLGAADPIPGRQPIQRLPGLFSAGLLRPDALKSMD